MGVAGSGKTTIGKLLAERLGWQFFDADDYHPAANVAKMAQGIPLQDADRWPWLKALAGLLEGCLAEGRGAVLACSALKRAYRERLRVDAGRVRFVYLKGDHALLWQRLQQRQGHYMRAEMLRSQFAALEEPEDAWVVDAAQPEEEIVKEIAGLAAAFKE